MSDDDYDRRSSRKRKRETNFTDDIHDFYDIDDSPLEKKRRNTDDNDCYGWNNSAKKKKIGDLSRDKKRKMTKIFRQVFNLTKSRQLGNVPAHLLPLTLQKY